MKGEDRFVAHFYRASNFACKARRDCSLPFARPLSRRRRSPAAAQVIDRHLETLAKQHLETKFVRVRLAALPPHACFCTHLVLTTSAAAQIDAEKSPFLVEKLKIWMLPTLALCRLEKVVDYVVGLDDMGGKEDFATDALRERLAAAGCVHADGVPRPPVGAAAAPRGLRQGGRATAADDEDSDFD